MYTLNYLNNVINSTAIIKKCDVFCRLWHIWIDNPVFNSDRYLGLQWLMLLLQQQRTGAIGQEIMRPLLTEKLTTVDISLLMPHEVVPFWNLFIWTFRWVRPCSCTHTIHASAWRRCCGLIGFNLLGSHRTCLPCVRHQSSALPRSSAAQVVVRDRCLQFWNCSKGGCSQADKNSDSVEGVQTDRNTPDRKFKNR